MKALYSSYILIVTVLLPGQNAHAQKAKSVNRKAQSSVSGKKVTEQQAKRINEAQLAKEGKVGTRRAYKRSDIEKLLHTEQDEWATAAENEQHTTIPAFVIEKKQPPVKKEPAAVVQNVPREPKFIESIVLERRQ
jgi:hypothetical protein